MKNQTRSKSKKKLSQKPILNMEDFYKRFYPVATEVPSGKILIVIPRPGV